MHYIKYFSQWVACESEDLPNVFIISDEAFLDLTLRDLLRLLPFPQRGNCLFRFKRCDSICGYVWEDIMDGKAVLPTFDNQIFVKILRLDKISITRNLQLKKRANPQIGLILISPATLPDLMPPSTPPTVASGYVPTCGEFADIDEGPSHNNNNNLNMTNTTSEVNPSITATSNPTSYFEQVVKPAVDAYTLVPNSSNFKNIRTLLSSLHTMSSLLCISPPIRETSLDMLILPSQVKSAYRKSLLVTHPDRHGSSEIEAFVSKRVFEALNVSYKEFVEKEGL